MDEANLSTLAGGFFAVGAVKLVYHGAIRSALILACIAILLDHLDGYVARMMHKYRTPRVMAFGARMDCFVDMISKAFFPTMLVLSYCEPAWHDCLAPVICLSMVVRYSDENEYGTIKGLSMDYFILAVANVYLTWGVAGVVMWTPWLVLGMYPLTVVPWRVPAMPKRVFVGLMSFTLLRLIMVW